jgi:hypothetical protein
MLTRIVLVVAAAGFMAVVAGAQTASQPATAPVASAPAAPTETWLRVVRDDVNVRSRPDVNSVPVVRVARNTSLRAVGLDPYGWYRVVPPEGVFSLVAAEYVDRRGPEAGVVSTRATGLRVRVGSLVREVDPLRSEVQMVLERGTPVRIVGEQGSWLKIEPPAGVYLWVSREQVEPVDEAAAARLPRPSLASRPAMAESAPVASRPAAPPDLTGPWGQKMLQVEAAVSAEARKPWTEQRWTDAIAQLRPIAEQREEPAVARLASAWITRLEQRTADQAAARDTEELVRRAARDQALHARELDRIERSRQATSGPVFAARGVLLRSRAVPDEDGRRLYRLEDPLTKRLEAYVEFVTPGKIDAEQMVGQYVGVRGPRRADATLGADVIRVEELVPFDADEATTRPARQERSPGID